MNKVILTGNLCRDIEVNQTQSGKEVVSNSIAVKRDFKDADGNYQTDFINFVAWGNQATYLGDYAKKGDRMEIVGRWQVRSFEDQNGDKRTVNECVVESVSVFSKNEKQDQKQTRKPKLEPVDDLPF